MKRGEEDIFRWVIKEEEVLESVVATELHPKSDGENIFGLGCK
jgi:hypothetical protein